MITDIRQYCEHNQDNMVAMLKRLEGYDTSPETVTVDGFFQTIKNFMTDNNIRSTSTKLGKSPLRPTYMYDIDPTDSDHPPILFMGHIDTVHPPRGCTEKDGKLFGSGVLDMKGGLVILLYTLKYLNQINYSYPIRVILTSDEEQGHDKQDTSTFTYMNRMVEACAGCCAGFSYETASRDRSIIVSRSGRQNWTVDIKGKSAHVGRDRNKGKCALTEAIKMIDAISHNDQNTQITPTIFHAGTVPNAIAGEAQVVFDVRYKTVQELSKHTSVAFVLMNKLNRKWGYKATLTKQTGIPPMVEAQGNVELYHYLVDMGKQYDFHVGRAIHSAGAGDATYAVLAGVPIIDQMGAEGAGNHTPDEFIYLDSLKNKLYMSLIALTNIDKFKYEG